MYALSKKWVVIAVAMTETLQPRVAWTVKASARAASRDDESGPGHLPTEVRGLPEHDQLEDRGLRLSTTQRSECSTVSGISCQGVAGKQWNNSSPIAAYAG